MRRVVAALELIQHSLTKMGHRETSFVNQTLRSPNSPAADAAAGAPATSFNRREAHRYHERSAPQRSRVAWWFPALESPL